MRFDVEFVIAVAMIATGIFLLYRVVRARRSSSKPEEIRFDRARQVKAPPPADDSALRETDSTTKVD